MKCSLKSLSRRKPAYFFLASVLSVSLLSACSGGGGGDDEVPTNTGIDSPPHEDQPVPPNENAVKDGPKYDLATYPQAGGDQINRHGTWVAVGSYTVNAITYRTREILRISASTTPLMDSLESCTAMGNGVLKGDIPANDTLFSIPGREFTVVSTTDMSIAVSFSDGESFELTGELRAHKISSDPDIAVGEINITATTMDYDTGDAPALVQMFDDEHFPVRCFGEAETNEPGPSIFEIYGQLIPNAPTIAVAGRHIMNVYFGDDAMNVTSETFVSSDAQPQGHLFSLEKDVDDDDDNDLTKNEFNVLAATEGATVIENLWDTQQHYESEFHMEQLDYLKNGKPPTASGVFVLDAYFSMNND